MGTVCSLPAFRGSEACKNQFLDTIASLHQAAGLPEAFAVKAGLPVRLLQTISILAMTTPRGRAHWHMIARLLVSSIPVGADTIPLTEALPPERLMRTIRESCSRARAEATNASRDSKLLYLVGAGAYFYNWWLVAGASMLYAYQQQVRSKLADQLEVDAHALFVEDFLETAEELKCAPTPLRFRQYL